ncbi:hypothetical protein, partial [Bordetella pseudohinzii]
ALRKDGKLKDEITKIKAENAQKDKDEYEADLKKEQNSTSTEFQVGAAVGLGINNVNTQVTLGSDALISTAGGGVTVEAVTRYTMQYQVMTAVDDKAIADRQAFLKKKNDVTSDQVERNVGPDGSDLGAAAAVSVAIDSLRTKVDMASGASIATLGGEVDIAARTLDQIDPLGLWLVNLYKPFDGIETAWSQATDTAAKAKVAGAAAGKFLNTLQATLTSSGGISNSFSSWTSANSKSKKLALA